MENVYICIYMLVSVYITVEVNNLVIIKITSDYAKLLAGYAIVGYYS
jgi:hypothetical protein